MLAECLGGWWSGSLAVITDAVHLLCDVAGYAISLMAIHWAKRPATPRLSYGYQRAEILGALGSLALIWALTGYLVMEAIERIRYPTIIDGPIMFATAFLGLLVNLIMIFILKHKHEEHDLETGHHHHSPNLRAALIHAIGDMVQSIGVLLASALIWWKPEWHLADPLCTFAFSLIVIGSTVYLTHDLVMVLMEACPTNLDAQAVGDSLRAIGGVREVHDLHIWSLAPGKPTLTVHLVADDWGLLADCRRVLKQQWSIHHATIQIEPPGGVDHECHPCNSSREDLLNKHA